MYPFLSKHGTDFFFAPLLAALVLLTVTQAIAQERNSLGSRIDSYVQELADDGEFSGALLVVVDDETLVSKGYGLANIELNVENAPEIKFRIGSITKQFTSMAILILRDRGKLDLQDTLGSHLSEIPSTWEGLTLHQILTHTSGLMHSWALPEFATSSMVPQSADNVLALFYDEPLAYAPGEHFNYSGLGYFVLAMVIEKVSGLAYHEFLEQEIFEPLGMTNTGGDRPDLLLANRASGYVESNGELTNAPFIYMPILTGGGDLYSTIGDLDIWSRAMHDGLLISSDSYELMYKPELNNYGYGWWVGDLDGKLNVWHTGSVSGFRAAISRIPIEKTHLVILSNFGFARTLPIIGHLMEMAAE